MKKVNGKFVVSEEIDKAMKSFIPNENWTVAEIVETLTAQGGFRLSIRKVLNTLPVHEVVQLYTEGYTVEKKKGLALLIKNEPTDKGIDDLISYRDKLEGSPVMGYSDGVYDGIRFALTQLNIEIVGINK